MKKLHKSSKLLSTIYELNPDAIVLTTVTDSKIIDCNQEYLNQIGYTRDEVIGHTSLELNLISPEEREHILIQLEKKKQHPIMKAKSREKTALIFMFFILPN